MLDNRYWNRFGSPVFVVRSVGMHDSNGTVHIRATLLLLCTLVAVCVRGQNVSFVDHFANCHTNDSEFDDCIKDALNDVRPFFKTGVPELNIPPFDPFFAAEVPQSKGGSLVNYKLKLKNVRESGWAVSQVTRFRSDLANNLIQYTQSFPDKLLVGGYEFVGTLLGARVVNSGDFNLTLYDLVQTTTVSRRPRRSDADDAPPLKVHVDVQTIRNLDLHISNLVGGRAVLESFVDRVINAAWEPGFAVIRPLINDLVSTAFTKIFDDAFRHFDFSRIVH